MGRPPRGQNPGYAYHVLNRGNGGATIFPTDEDYRAFLDLLATAKSKFPVNVFGFCVMPTHFHIVLQPQADDGLSLFMQWWQTRHARYYHQHHRSHGHLWEGRYKSFPIQQDGHFLTTLRYVLRNPVRAGLVPTADQWPWSSTRHLVLTDPWPIDIPPDWDHWVQEPLSVQELARIRTCVNRQAPFGNIEWRERTAQILGLASTLRSHGRPRKSR